MTRQNLIERILRHVYGEQPTDDSNITINLCNAWLSDGIALAAKQNYKESAAIDNISYLNNSFYITYKGLVPVKDENNLYKVTLPQIPLGLGVNNGVSSAKLKDTNGLVSHSGIPLEVRQVNYSHYMPEILNAFTYYSEGQFLYIRSLLTLDTGYTVSVRMASGGDSTTLTSTVNVPDDYIPVIIQYVADMLMKERMAPKDAVADGVDKP